MNIVIRPYAEADFEPLTEVWFASWESIGLGIPTPQMKVELREKFPRDIAAGWSGYVATAGAQIVGFLTLQGDRLQQLFVAPDLQGRGIGKQLLDFVKAQRPNGFYLTTPTKGRAALFYEREGLERGAVTTLASFGHEVVRYDWRP